MYGIQRNVKKISGKKEVRKDEPMVLEIDEYADYSFILDGEVPAGYYYSKIVHAEPMVTKSKNEPAVMVFYKIKGLRACYKILNGEKPTKKENKIYRVKEVYPMSTQYYKNFVRAMQITLGLSKQSKPTTKDVVGVEEHIFIGFDGPGKFGSIKNREPFIRENYIEDEVDEHEDTDLSAVIDPDAPIYFPEDDWGKHGDSNLENLPAIPIEQSADDEFDDFYDEFDF